jgi:hypothetical protein
MRCPAGHAHASPSPPPERPGTPLLRRRALRRHRRRLQGRLPVDISISTDGGLWQSSVNSKGNGLSFTWTDQGFTDKKSQRASKVTFVYIRVCVDDAFADTCRTSGKLYNPYR